MEDKMKILIGYDGSASADAALDDLQQAGLPDECVALVMSVAEVWLPPPPPSSYEIIEMTESSPKSAGPHFTYEKQLRAVEDAKANAERAAIRLKTNFPKWDISTEGTSGSPAWELIFKAEQWKPELIVVGSQGRSALGRFVLGSVSQRVLAEAACSVRVARGRVEERSPVRIIVGIDGSAGAEAAVRAVAARNWPAQSEAKVVVVDDPIEPTTVGALIPGVSQSLADENLEYRKRITAMVEDAAKRVNSENLKATGIVEQGNPKRVIVKLAEEWGANCIFVGSTGFSSRLERFLIGSVASAIASRAHCSVEVVREPKKG
jgi:nucleotide-binding universal stress UspA family protein